MRRWTKDMQYHAMRIRHVGGCLIVAGLSVGIPQRALAQTASQLTEPNYAPPVVRQVRGGFTLPATAGLAPPQGAETLVVTPAGLSVVGGLAPLEAETAAINARLSGKQVSGADLFAAARDLEAAYARAGYLLVRVSLPPQTIIDGQPLRLVVTDGYVEAVDATALPSLVRGRLAAVLSPLVGQKGLTRHDLERRLLLASDVPGVMLRSTLKPGGKPGATILVVDGRYDPVTASVSVDNGLSGELGQYPLGLGAEFNGLIGLGEVGYVRSWLVLRCHWEPTDCGSASKAWTVAPIRRPAWVIRSSTISNVSPRGSVIAGYEVARLTPVQC
jgi:hemolysin activation/secretion protein